MYQTEPPFRLIRRNPSWHLRNPLSLRLIPSDDTSMMGSETEEPRGSERPRVSSSRQLAAPKGADCLRANT